jgi:hypothetical protein
MAAIGLNILETCSSSSGEAKRFIFCMTARNDHKHLGKNEKFTSEIRFKTNTDKINEIKELLPSSTVEKY